MRRLTRRERYLRQLAQRRTNDRYLIEALQGELSELRRRFHNFQVRIGIDERTGKPPTIFQGGSNTIELAKEY